MREMASEIQPMFRLLLTSGMRQLGWRIGEHRLVGDARGH
jgi:hypothetical protein